jgi:hypothetical protein
MQEANRMTLGLGGRLRKMACPLPDGVSLKAASRSTGMARAWKPLPLLAEPIH